MSLSFSLIFIKGISICKFIVPILSFLRKRCRKINYVGVREGDQFLTVNSYKGLLEIALERADGKQRDEQW